MLWVIILHSYKSLTHKLHSRLDYMILHYAVIAGLIQFALHLMHILDFAIGKSPIHYNIPSSMLYSWCYTGGCSSFMNSSPHIDLPIWVKDFWDLKQESFYLSSLHQIRFVAQGLWSLSAVKSSTDYSLHFGLFIISIPSNMQINATGINKIHKFSFLFLFLSLTIETDLMPLVSSFILFAFTF